MSYQDDFRYVKRRGLTLDNVRIRNGKLLEELPVPEREGYTFIGWFSDPEYRTPFTASSVTEDGGSVNIYKMGYSKLRNSI